MKNIFCLGIALIILISACSPTRPLLQQLPTSLPTTSLMPTQSPTPSETIVPSHMATGQAEATAYTSTQIAKEQEAMTDCLGYSSRAHSPDRYYSLEKNWYVAYCEYPDTHFNYTAIIKADNSTRWEVPFYETWGSQQISDAWPDGIKDGEMSLFAWSPDEKYVFLNPYFCCLDGPGMMFVAGYGLFQLDLATGTIAQIDGGSAAFALSPDTKKLARYDYDAKQVIIQNLETGNNVTFKINPQFEIVGIFNWSPDGDKVVFSAADENWFDEASGFTVYLIDLNKRNIRQLLYEPPHYYVAIEWSTNEEIIIAEATYPPQYKFNITTDQLSLLDLEAVTPSPSP